MHGIENFFVQIGQSIVGIWRGRSLVSRSSMFGDREAERRSRRWMTVIAVVVTIFLITLAVGVIYLFWWMFTIHERHPAQQNGSYLPKPASVLSVHFSGTSS